jgi:hypothetical protein
MEFQQRPGLLLLLLLGYMAAALGYMAAAAECVRKMLLLLLGEREEIGGIVT